eukprot:9255871-Pyramimonas_sp.AAC.2
MSSPPELTLESLVPPEALAALDGAVANQTAAGVEDGLGRALQASLADSKTRGPPSTAEEEDLKRVIQTGSLDVHSKLGKAFMYQKSCDQELKENWEKTKKSKDMRDEFKVNWAKRELDKRVAKRQRTQTTSFENFKKGKFKPFSVIVRDEGSDPCAVKAASNICRTCIALWRKNITCSG